MRIEGLLFVELTGPTTVVRYGLREGLRVNVSWDHLYERIDLGSAAWSVKPFRRWPGQRLLQYQSATYEPGSGDVVGKLFVTINDYEFACLRAYAGSGMMAFEEAVAELVDVIWGDARDTRKLQGAIPWSCRLPPGAKWSGSDTLDCPF